MSRRHGIVPPYLLEQITQAANQGLLVEPQVADDSRRTLALDATFRSSRAQALEAGPGPRPQALGEETAEGGADDVGQRWTVHDADNQTRLPGRAVRDETDADESGDVSVDEAWAGVEATLAMLTEVFGRSSYDDAGARVLATVHYGRNYDNAFWDGKQLVFGDGDGRVFERFTKPVDVLAHELGHAVTEHLAGLVYQGQPGALNESMSDVVGACLKQRVLGQTAEEGDWLIGEGLFRPEIDARALRDMANPGTAYDDPALGRDPQPDHMDRYVETDRDNGGVHINSGIPNRAFHLAATAVGGSSAEGAGRIWIEALGQVGPRADFAAFAAATVAAAGEHADAVREAWSGVGVEVPDDGGAAPGGEVEPGAGTGVPLEPGAEAERGAVVVRRSGGITGITLEGVLYLDDDGDPRTPEVRVLVHRINFRAVAHDLGGEPSHPDAFLYTFLCDGERADVPEQHVTPDLHRLAELVLFEQS
ncbi:M4 family metallopeptidase [Antribacter gilvus]|uniref:M4 family metallopeptidase n=1 Tax=Antribacter gilvus TaxID=2304675 RepID=UPI000F79642F|nr:M4 family metallopeptidase [Antribacter gilvus]